MAAPSNVVGTEFPTGTQASLTTTALTLVHQAPTQAGVFDQISIWATNTDRTSDQWFTVFWAGDVDPDNTVPMLLPIGAGPCLVVPGWPLQRGLTVKVKADVANKINLTTVISPISPYQ